MAAVDPQERLGIPFDPRRAPERDDVMTKPTNILIVDDEPNIILSLQFLMAKAGYAVRTAKDGEQALAEIARERPSSAEALREISGVGEKKAQAYASDVARIVAEAA